MFTALCCLVYFTSYLTRVNYGAVMPEMIAALGMTKEAASMAVTGSFITYGLGQLLCGWWGDRIPPRTMIFWGLTATAACNLLLPQMGGPVQMTLLWSLNGFFQSMLWPPLVRIMVDQLTPQEYAHASVSVSVMSSVGTIAVYFLAPACVFLGSWKTVFFIPAAFGLCTAFFWRARTRALPARRAAADGPDKRQLPNGGKVMRSAILFSGLPILMLAIVLQGMLRDGITTWMPVYLTETFGMQTYLSILSAAILPMFSILGVVFASNLQMRLRNEAKTSGALFATGMVAAVLMLFCWQMHIALSIALLAVVFSCVSGVNTMLISRIPPYFLRYRRVAVISGVLNAFTYVGSSLSSFGVARLTGWFGWSATFLFWAVAAVCGTLCCLICIPRWRRFVLHVFR